MTNLKYVLWFFQTIGVALILGFSGAFFLSRFSGVSETTRSRVALALAIFIAVGMLSSPRSGCGTSLDDILPSIVYAAFGLTFAVDRLRIQGGHSVSGWICAVFNGLFIKALFEELMGKV